VRDGAIEGGSRAAQVAVVDALDPVAERLAGWRGAVFIKGSRRYQLERLLDASSTPAPAH
jgi:UDP-N-acetylmuramoyl-tripeptide--D-alanyl-D-alanine ligase